MQLPDLKDFYLATKKPLVVKSRKSRGLKAFIAISFLCLTCLFLGRASSFSSVSSAREVQGDVVERESDEIKVAKRQTEDEDVPLPPAPPANGGATYVRWGRTDCPAEANTQLIYEGIAAGSHYSHLGGGANYLCLHSGITYQMGDYIDGFQDSSYLYGVEYWGNTNPFFDTSQSAAGQNLHNNAMPCAVCLANQRRTQLMIPGKSQCPGGWTKEYTGWIMAEAHVHAHSGEYVCVDETPQVVPGTGSDHRGALLYMVETSCPSLQCQPFVNGRELRCVVCSI